MCALKSGLHVVHASRALIVGGSVSRGGSEAISQWIRANTINLCVRATPIDLKLHVAARATARTRCNHTNAMVLVQRANTGCCMTLKLVRNATEQALNGRSQTYAMILSTFQSSTPLRPSHPPIYTLPRVPAAHPSKPVHSFKELPCTEYGTQLSHTMR